MHVYIYITLNIDHVLVAWNFIRYTLFKHN